MKIKKILLVTCATILLPLGITAQEMSESIENQNDTINWFTHQPEYHSFSIEQTANNYHSFHLYTLSIELKQTTDMKELAETTGLLFSRQKFDLTNDTHYAPTLWNCFNPGIRMINHYNWNFGDFFEYDFLTGLYTSYTPFNFLKLSFSAMFHLKTSVIYDNYKITGPLISTCPAFDLVVSYTPIEWAEIEASLSSFDFFKYYLFFSPIFGIKFNFKVNPSMNIFVSYNAQFVDFFTLSANFANFNTKLGATWRF